LLKIVYGLPLTIVESIDRAIIRRAGYFKTSGNTPTANFHL